MFIFTLIENKLINSLICNRSSKTSDLIKDGHGVLLRIPTATRWNSLYDAVGRLLEIFNDREKLTALNHICSNVNVPPFVSSKSAFTFIVNRYISYR